MAVYGKSSMYLLAGSRWTLFAVGLLSYARNVSADTAGVILAAAALQALCTWARLAKPRSRLTALAVGADLLFQVDLLWAAGGLSGPFIFYSLSGLAMLKAYMRWNAYYASTLMYLTALPLLQALLDRTTVSAYLASHWTYICFFALFYGLSGIVQYTYNSSTAHLKKLAMIYARRHPLGESEPWAAVCDIEELLKRLLDRQEVWICAGGPGLLGPDPSWVHAYYADSLRLNPPPAAKTYLQMTTPIGETAPMYVRALRDRYGEAYGWLLLGAERNELSLIQKVYIQLSLMKLEADYDANKRLKTMRDGAVAVERSAIAQNIHDGIAEELFFYSEQLSRLRSLLQKDGNGEALRLASELEAKVKASHRDIRRWVEELKRRKRTFDLLDAIENMLHRTRSDGHPARLRKRGLGSASANRDRKDDLPPHRRGGQPCRQARRGQQARSSAGSDERPMGDHDQG